MATEEEPFPLLNQPTTLEQAVALRNFGDRESL